MSIISASALKEQGSSKCGQKSRKRFSCLQLRAAVTLVGDEGCIRHAAGRWNKAIQRVAWKASRKRASTARAQKAPLWWPGKELSPLTWCWRFKYTLCEKRSMPWNANPPLMNITSSQGVRCNRWHLRGSLSLRVHEFAPAEERLCKYVQVCAKCHCQRLYMSGLEGLVFQSSMNVSS